MTMTPSQALRAPRAPEGAGSRAAASFDLDGTLIPGSANTLLAMGQRLTVALIGSLIALGTRPVEALGGIDGDPEDDAPTGDRPDRSAATAA